nr:mannan-binding lectin serine protease 1-like [Drosophila bipectinata]
MWNGELLTQPNEHPWIGKIEANDGARRLLCVAVLIGARHALTASRCVHDPSVEIKDLVFGDWSSGNTSTYITAKATQKVPVNQIIIHPDYKYGEFGNNVAIIELKENVVNTDFVQSICLPTDEHQKYSEDLTVAGYERPFLEAIPLETRRIKLPLESSTSQECRTQFENFPKEFTCGHTSRMPLSGSALVVAVGNPKKFKLIGIVVGGFRSSSGKKDMQIHIKILSQLDWILRNTSE